MALSKKERKKLQIEYDIESTENLYGRDSPKELKWLNRFHITRGGSFWNWLWMCHFKAPSSNKPQASSFKQQALDKPGL